MASKIQSGTPQLLKDAAKTAADLAARTHSKTAQELAVWLADGNVSIRRVLGQIVRHPRALPGLVRLGRQSKIAAESLANFLDRYVGALISQAVSPAALAMAAVERQIV